ncbi:TPA: EAL domain-containing protein [Pseudomonas aeruginosa]
MAFNIHPAQLKNNEFSGRVSALLREYAVSATNVNFELAGLGLWGDDLVVFDDLYSLRLLGCRLSIDDFGIGYLSLQRLAELPFTKIKRLISYLSMQSLTSPRELCVVESVLPLAHALEVNAVAEGIETQSQLEMLRGLGYSYGQGFLFY